MTLKALIWDVDGTLAETEEAHRAAFNRTFSARGLDWEWDWDKYRDLLRVTGGVERMTHYVRTERPDALPDDAMVETVHAMHKQKTAEYVAALQRGELPLRPGVARLLAEARDAGMRLAIATTTSAPNISALLDHSPDPVRLDWFEVVGAGGVIPNKKPAPDIYLWTLERLGLSGADCLAMEDSRNGLDSATAAGVPAVITTSSYTRDQQFPGALAVADSLGEPDAPMQLVSGDGRGRRWIDLDLLRQWHRNGR